MISARLPQAGLPEGVIGSHITREMMPVNNRSAQNIGYGLRALIDELAAQGVEHRNLLPFVAEFWRSSMVALLGEILDESFPSRRMLFPYPKPDYAHAYPAFFDCPLEFGCDAMEWHFDAAVLAKPCPNASSLTASICQDFCESLTVRSDDDSLLQRELRGFILGNTGRRCTADEAAAALGLSKRTMFRRLSQEGTSFQVLQDQTRDAVAREYLENTRLPVSDIAERCGFGDEANFRKAFLRWRGQTPSKWRREKHLITMAGSQKN